MEKRNIRQHIRNSLKEQEERDTDKAHLGILIKSDDNEKTLKDANTHDIVNTTKPEGGKKKVTIEPSPEMTPPDASKPAAESESTKNKNGQTQSSSASSALQAEDMAIVPSTNQPSNIITADKIKDIVAQPADKIKDIVAQPADKIKDIVDQPAEDVSVLKRKRLEDELDCGISPTETQSLPDMPSTMRVFPCSHRTCNKVFTSNGHLTRHMKIHLGTRPFACPIPGCTSRFSRNDNMLQHFRNHQKKIQKQENKLKSFGSSKLGGDSRIPGNTENIVINSPAESVSTAPVECSNAARLPPPPAFSPLRAHTQIAPPGHMHSGSLVDGRVQGAHYPPPPPSHAIYRNSSDVSSSSSAPNIGPHNAPAPGPYLPTATGNEYVACSTSQSQISYVSYNHNQTSRPVQTYSSQQIPCNVPDCHCRLPQFGYPDPPPFSLAPPPLPSHLPHPMHDPIPHHMHRHYPPPPHHLPPGPPHHLHHPNYVPTHQGLLPPPSTRPPF